MVTLSFQLLVVYILSEMPSEGSGTWMGARMLVEDVPTPVLPFISARGSNPGATRHCHAVLGCGAGRGGFGRQTRRAVVQYSRASGVCVPGWMGVSHAHLARTRWNASGRNCLQERRSHPHRRPLCGARVHFEVRV